MPHKRTFLTVTVLFLLLFSFFLTPLTTANATHVNGAVHTTTNTTQQEDPGFAARAAEWLVKQVIIVVVMLSMLFLLFGGILMDTSINFTIYGFGNFARLESIVTIWETFRDAANIALIFVFLFIAIMTILGSQNYGARRLLAKAIIVALILNFSLFFARLVPDLANQLAVQFHKSMVTFEAKAAVQQTATAATQNQAFLGGTKVEVNGLSGAFMQVLGITSVLNWDAINNAMTDSGPIGTGRQATFGIGMAILFFTLAGVFFSAALLLISRLIILIILMVLSAPAFVAYALPKTSNLGSTWMKTLINQSLIAPVFLGFIWVTMKILTSLAWAGQGSFSGLLAGGNAQQTITSVNLLFIFIFAVALVLASIHFSKQLAGKGGAAAMSVGNWMNRRVGGATLGAAGAAGRGVAGRNAARLRDGAVGRGLDRVTASNLPILSSLSKATRTALTKTSEASFDVRNTKGFKDATKKIGVDYGAGQKGGYAKWASKQAEERAQAKERLVQAEEAKKIKYAKTPAGEMRLSKLEENKASAQERIDANAKIQKAQRDAVVGKEKQLQEQIRAGGPIDQQLRNQIKVERDQLRLTEESGRKMKASLDRIDRDIKGMTKKGEYTKQRLTESADRAENKRSITWAYLSPSTDDKNFATELRKLANTTKDSSYAQTQILKDMKASIDKGNKKDE